jgi:hypothetical protein
VTSASASTAELEALDSNQHHNNSTAHSYSHIAHTDTRIGCPLRVSVRGVSRFHDASQPPPSPSPPPNHPTSRVELLGCTAAMARLLALPQSLYLTLYSPASFRAFQHKHAVARCLAYSKRTSRWVSSPTRSGALDGARAIEPE